KAGEVSFQIGAAEQAVFNLMLEHQQDTPVPERLALPEEIEIRVDFHSAAFCKCPGSRFKAKIKTLDAGNANVRHQTSIVPSLTMTAWPPMVAAVSSPAEISRPSSIWLGRPIS